MLLLMTSLQLDKRAEFGTLLRLRYIPNASIHKVALPGNIVLSLRPDGGDHVVNDAVIVSHEGRWATSGVTLKDRFDRVAQIGLLSIDCTN